MTEGTAQLRSAVYHPQIRSHGVQLAPRLGWRVAQMVADFLTVFTAATVAYGLYLLSGIGQQHFAPAFYIKFNLVFAVLTGFALNAAGAYRNQMGLLRIESIRRVLLAVGGGLLLVLVLSFMQTLPTTLSRLTVLMLGPVIVMALVAQRFALWTAQEKLTFLHRSSRPILVYGAGETGRLLAGRLLDEHHLGLKPVGFIDDRKALANRRLRVGPGIEGKRIPVMGGQAKLDAAIRRSKAAAVFLAMPSAPCERIADLVAYLETRNVPYYCTPSAGEILFSGLQFTQVAGLPVFTRRRPTLNRVYDLAKRAIDVTVALTTLTATFPLLALSALLVKLTSPGPVLFSQTRIGENGEAFTIFKLRTMHRDAPKYARHPDRADDERISAVGRWLRRLSIDELPQLWNVLCGEMSLVGPRPEMPFVVEQYNDIQRQRLSVKPGISGLWQISEDRAFSIHDNIHYDLYYVENRSLSLDLAILVMTPFIVLARRGAK